MRTLFVILLAACLSLAQQGQAAALRRFVCVYVSVSSFRGFGVLWCERKGPAGPGGQFHHLVSHRWILSLQSLTHTHIHDASGAARPCRSGRWSWRPRTCTV